MVWNWHRRDCKMSPQISTTLTNAWMICCILQPISTTPRTDGRDGGWWMVSVQILWCRQQLERSIQQGFGDEISTCDGELHQSSGCFIWQKPDWNPYFFRNVLSKNQLKTKVFLVVVVVVGVEQLQEDHVGHARRCGQLHLGSNRVGNGNDKRWWSWCFWCCWKT